MHHFLKASKEHAFYCGYITVTSLCALISLILLISLASKFANPNAKIAMSSFFRHTTLISMFACTLCIFADLIHFFVALIMDIDLLSNATVITVVVLLANIFYYIGCIMFYVILVMRVYYCFKGTIYELNKSMYTFLWFLISMSVLTSIYHVFVMLFAPNLSRQSDLKQPAFILLMLSDAFLNVVLFILFIYKLRECTIKTETLADYNSCLTTQTKKTLEVVVRHSILFGSAILSNQFFYASAFAVSFYPAANNILVGIMYQLRSLENLGNVAVLYLSMKINHMLYITLCRICNDILLKCCERNVKQKARRQSRTEIELELSITRS